MDANLGADDQVVDHVLLDVQDGRVCGLLRFRRVHQVRARKKRAVELGGEARSKPITRTHSSVSVRTVRMTVDSSTYTVAATHGKQYGVEL